MKKILTTIVNILSVSFNFLKNVFILIVALIAILLESIWNLIKDFRNGVSTLTCELAANILMIIFLMSLISTILILAANGLVYMLN